MKKKFLLLIILAAFTSVTNAQLSGVLKKAGNKVNEKINKKEKESIDSRLSQNEKGNPTENDKSSETITAPKDTPTPVYIKA